MGNRECGNKELCFFKDGWAFTDSGVGYKGLSLRERLIREIELEIRFSLFGRRCWFGVKDGRCKSIDKVDLEGWEIGRTDNEGYKFEIIFAFKYVDRVLEYF
jgi:hypothetical protein